MTVFLLTAKLPSSQNIVKVLYRDDREGADTLKTTLRPAAIFSEFSGAFVRVFASEESPCILIVGEGEECGS